MAMTRMSKLTSYRPAGTVTLSPSSFLPSGILQPLDVEFFNSLKLAYLQQVDQYHLGSIAPQQDESPNCFSVDGLQRSCALAAKNSEVPLTPQVILFC